MGALTRNINKDDGLRVTGRPEDSAKQETGPSPAEQLADQASNVVTQLGQRLPGQPRSRDQLIEQAQDSLEQPISPELKDAIETVRSAVGGSSTISFMSLQGLFYQAMSVLTEFDIKQMKSFLDFLSKAAQAMGGIDENGHIVAGQEGGLLGKQLQLSFDGADLQRDAMKLEATGHLIQAGFGVAGLGAAGVSAIKTRMGGLDQQQTRFTEFQKDLNTSTKADFVLAGKGAGKGMELSETTAQLTKRARGEALDPSGPQEATKILDRMNEISSDKTKLREFIGELNNPKDVMKYNDAQAVLSHLKANRGDPVFEKVSKNTKSLIEGVESQKNANHQKFNSQMQINGMFVSAGGSAAQGGTKFVGSDAQVKSEKKKAEAEMVRTLAQQGYQNTVVNAKAAADGAASDASATAALYGNIKA